MAIYCIVASEAQGRFGVQSSVGGGRTRGDCEGNRLVGDWPAQAVSTATGQPDTSTRGHPAAVSHRAQGQAGERQDLMRDDGMSINVRLKTELLASLDRWIDGLSGATL